MTVVLKRLDFTCYDIYEPSHFGEQVIGSRGQRVIPTEYPTAIDWLNRPVTVGENEVWYNGERSFA